MSRTILVVDDEPNARSLLRLILVRAGFEVIVAQDGFEALREIQDQIPDAMILDIMMPGIDGFEVCERLRNNEETADLPIIMLSARADSESINKGLSLGATMYLTKPVTPEELTREVEKVLGIEGGEESSH